MTKRRATLTSLNQWLTSRSLISIVTKYLIYIYSPFPAQNKLEAQYAAKRDAHQMEVTDLKAQLEMRVNEIRSLNASIESLKSVNEELKVSTPLFG